MHSGTVHVEDLIAYCQAKPGARLDQPWPDHLVAKVGDKMFVMFDAEAEAGAAVGLKCGRSREEADDLVSRYPGDVAPMAYLGRYGWNTVRLGGALGEEDLLELVDASYDDVVSRLPRLRRPGPAGDPVDDPAGGP